MSLKLQTHSIDFVQNKASIALTGEKGAHVIITFSLPTPGNQTEEELRAASKVTARRLLQEAISSL